MSERPKILCVCDYDDATRCVPEALRVDCDVVVERDPLKAFARLAEEKFAGVYVVSPHLNESLQVGRLLQNEQILVGMPDGVVLLDPENVVLWGNPQFRQWCGGREVVGQSFFAALSNPEILGPDFCPFSHGPGHGACQQCHTADRREPNFMKSTRPPCRLRIKLRRT